MKTTSDIPGSDVSFLLQNAALLIDSGDFLLARNLYSFVLHQNLRNPVALQGLGVCLFNLGEIPSAQRCFRAVWEVFKDALALVWVGRCYAADRKDDLALDTFAKVQEVSLPSPLDRHLFLREWGNALVRASRLDEALLKYLAALELKPDSDVLYANLGTLEIQRKKYEAARGHFLKVLKINPKSAKAYSGLGLVFMAQNDLMEAERHFLRALDLDGGSRIALYELLLVWERENNLPEAVRRITTYLEINPNDLSMRFALAGIYFQSANWVECEKTLDQILASDPKHVKALRLRDDLRSHKPLL